MMTANSFTAKHKMVGGPVGSPRSLGALFLSWVGLNPVKGGICYNCGEVGHFSWECSKCKKSTLLCAQSKTNGGHCPN